MTTTTERGEAGQPDAAAVHDDGQDQVETHAVTGSSPAGPRPEPDASLRELLSRVNRFLYDKRTGLFLILAMGVATLLGTIITQAPDDVRADPATYAQWLESVRPSYGGWTGPLRVLGMFGVFDSWWFAAITITLAASIVACTVHRIPQLTRQARHPHTHVRATFFDHARTSARVTLDVPADRALERTRRLLGRRRFRLLPDAKAPESGLYADRHRFAPFGTVIAHAAFVIILGGVLVTSLFGYTDSGFNVPVGGRADLGRGTDMTVEAKAFIDVYNPDGSPQDYASDLVLYQGGEKVAEKTIRVNSPLTHDGVSINQASFGVAADLTIADAEGTTLQTRTVPLQWQTQDRAHTYGSFELPEQDLEVYVITAASGQVNTDIAPGQVELEAYRLGQSVPVDQRVIDQNSPTEVAGLEFTFDRERRYTGLMVSEDPGEIWVWIGCSLLFLGTCWTMFLRHRRIWVQVTPTASGGSEVRLASPDRFDTSFQRHFHGIVTELAATPSTPGASASTSTPASTPSEPSTPTDPATKADTHA